MSFAHGRRADKTLLRAGFEGGDPAMLGGSDRIGSERRRSCAQGGLGAGEKRVGPAPDKPMGPSFVESTGHSRRAALTIAMRKRFTHCVTKYWAPVA
jgi:hypothetical protein